jgi:hypothetical protein
VCSSDLIKEIHGIQNYHYVQNKVTREEMNVNMTPPEMMVQIAEMYKKNGRHRPFFIFSDMQRGNQGTDLADFIEANNLGTVYRSERVMNENSFNRIVCYVWTVNKDAMKAWPCEQTSKE